MGEGDVLFRSDRHGMDKLNDRRPLSSRLFHALRPPTVRVPFALLPRVTFLLRRLVGFHRWLRTIRFLLRHGSIRSCWSVHIYSQLRVFTVLSLVLFFVFPFYAR